MKRLCIPYQNGVYLDWDMESGLLYPCDERHDNQPVFEAYQKAYGINFPFYDFCVIDNDTISLQTDSIELAYNLYDKSVQSDGFLDNAEFDSLADFMKELVQGMAMKPVNNKTDFWITACSLKFRIETGDQAYTIAKDVYDLDNIPDYLLDASSWIAIDYVNSICHYSTKRPIIALDIRQNNANHKWYVPLSQLVEKFGNRFKYPKNKKGVSPEFDTEQELKNFIESLI